MPLTRHWKTWRLLKNNDGLNQHKKNCAINQAIDLLFILKTTLSKQVTLNNVVYYYALLFDWFNSFCLFLSVFKLKICVRNWSMEYFKIDMRWTFFSQFVLFSLRGRMIQNTIATLEVSKQNFKTRCKLNVMYKAHKY